MTKYVVRSGAQKKKEILEKREESLLHLIRNNLPAERTEAAAERVRAAQLAVIKCLHHENEIVRSEDVERLGRMHEKLQAEEVYWQDLRVAGIIALYREKAARLSGEES